jgi:predicted amidohydrolase
VLVDGKLSIVAVQASPQNFSGSLNKFAEDLADVVARHPGVEMVIYPELHLFQPLAIEPGEKHTVANLDSVDIDSDFVRGLGDVARLHKIWLIPGSINEKGSAENLYNTALVFNPDGQVVARYRKIFPWRPFEPHTPGSTFVVFDIPTVGKIGLNTCYDIWFPETCRQLAWMGAELIINLVKTNTADRAQEVILTRANAIFNQVALLSVNSAGPEGVGCSLVVGPEGEVITDAMHTNRAELEYTFDSGSIERVRKNGTAGTNKMWKQFRSGDHPIPLPLYNGSIDPSRWTPSTDLPPTKEK